MFSFTRKPLGMWFISAFVLGASLFVSLLSSQTALAAVSGTWKNATTITVSGVDYVQVAGSSFLVQCTTTTSSSFQVFKPASGASRVFFNTGVNLGTATSGSYSSTGKFGSPCQETMTLTNTRAAATTPTSPTSPTSPTTTETTEITPVCNVGGLSFLFCPLIDLARGAISTVGGILDTLMVLNPLPLAGGAVFDAWSNVLNIANVILAIAFMVVIFAQATSSSLSSYSIKRMLPRIIAAAILMNLSYYICAFAIDLSNLAGSGVTTLLMTVSAVKVEGVPAGDSSDIGSLLTGVATVAYQGVATLGIIAVVLFFALVPTLLAVLAVVFVLAARQAIMILLVIIAPLAFALWVLPNTEKYFKKWWEWLIQMLVLYPMVMAVFAGATVASNIVSGSTAQLPDDPAYDKVEIGAFQGIIALIIMAMPLFALPALFKASGNVMGKLQSMTQGGIQKYGGNYANDYVKHQRGQLAAKAAGNERRGALGATGRFVGGYKGRRDFKMQQQKESAQRVQQQHVADKALTSDRYARSASGLAGGEGGVARVQASARATVARQEAEAVKMAVDSMKYRGIDSDRDALETEIRTTRDGSVAKAATSLLLNTGGSENFKGLLYDQSLMQRHGKAIIEAGRENYGVVDGKSPDVADFMAQSNAADLAASGAAAADIDTHTRVMNLSGGKMIKFEPNTMARMFRRAATMTPAEQASLQQQAILAVADKDFAQAKTATQEAIKEFAAGNFTTPPPSVIPADKRPGAAPGAKLPPSMW